MRFVFNTNSVQFAFMQICKALVKGLYCYGNTLDVHEIFKRFMTLPGIACFGEVVTSPLMNAAIVLSTDAGAVKETIVYGRASDGGDTSTL